MREIDVQNAAAYLQDVGLLAANELCNIRELAGGVSNLVLRVSFPDGHRPDFVLKQARPQLRTADLWYCTVERIWREVEVLRACGELLQQQPSNVGGDSVADRIALDAVIGDGVASYSIVPAVLFEDRDNYVFTMTAAPAAHTVWKADLLAGRVEPNIAKQCGRLLGELHAGSWGRADLAVRLADRQIFRELRLDPYYRHVARVHPDVAPHFQRLIDDNEARQLCLVHADFSPKNLLVYSQPVEERGLAPSQVDTIRPGDETRGACPPISTGGGLMLVDFETGHYGDPAFDLGFFLSHLLLKAIHRAPDHERYFDLTRQFWAAYEATLQPKIGDATYRELVARGIQNVAGCAWARIDGTSKVDYLQDPVRKDVIRAWCREVFHDGFQTWDQAIAAARNRLGSSLDWIA